ncbi:baseplate J/gp47 family protein [Desulfovibrio sp. OttesenSCG-928-A18]|nr:baseplate J/gp47 family protein [Desulfovibrio sp. OttesenSCG-928-A18]
MARSGLIFDPASGLYAPDTAQIREGVAEDWRQAFFDPDLPVLDTEPTTPAGQLIDAQVAEIEAKNAELLFLSSMFQPGSSEGRWQDALGYIYFLRRKLDEPTVVTCQLTGLNGTVVPYGALVQSAEGHTLICNRAVTIGQDGKGAGAAETTFRVSDNGPIDIAPHSVQSIVTVIPGWDTVDNAAAGALGRDLETRAEFEARRAASVAANAHGSTGALYGTIADLPGVLDVQVLENIGQNPVIKYGVTVPGHGITVCVYGGEDAAIAEAIYSKKDNGCDTGGNTTIMHLAADYHNAAYEYRILRPVTINFWVRVTLGAGSAPTEAQIAAIRQAIQQDFYGLNTQSGNARVGLASTVYASRFYCPALGALSSLSASDGVKSIQSVEIALAANAPGAAAYAALVTIRGDQEPVCSTATISVVVAGGAP